MDRGNPVRKLDWIRVDKNSVRSIKGLYVPVGSLPFISRKLRRERERESQPSNGVVMSLNFGQLHITLYRHV